MRLHKGRKCRPRFARILRTLRLNGTEFLQQVLLAQRGAVKRRRSLESRLAKNSGTRIRARKADPVLATSTMSRTPVRDAEVGRIGVGLFSAYWRGASEAQVGGIALLSGVLTPDRPRRASPETSSGLAERPLAHGPRPRQRQLLGFCRRLGGRSSRRYTSTEAWISTMEQDLTRGFWKRPSKQCLQTKLLCTNRKYEELAEVNETYRKGLCDILKLDLLPSMQTHTLDIHFAEVVNVSK